jgi:NADH dehydrogenase/NADH:ubiquinone oxidoreductase subunit G
MSASPLVDLTIDGRKVSVPAGTTIFDAARMHDVEIPTLCHQQNEKPVGVCRVCVVDVGARVYTASCIRPVEPGMVVKTADDGVKRARHTLIESWKRWLSTSRSQRHVMRRAQHDAAQTIPL